MALLRYLGLAGGLAALAALPAAGPPARPPACTYARVPAPVRPLLRHFDRAVPRALADLARAPGYALYLPPVDPDNCFREGEGSTAFPGPPALRARLGRHLQHLYYKPLGDYNAIVVLAYATPAAAAAAAATARHVLDSLLASCRGRDLKLEPCAGSGAYRVERRQACLVRYQFYSQDPMKQSGWQSLRLQL